MPDDPSIPPATDTAFPGRHLPGTPAGEARGMLPGMALIGMYLILMAMLNAFAAINGKFPGTAAKYSILTVCTLMVVGVFGLLRLKRWGWAIVTAGCLLMAGSYLYFFQRTHIAPYVLQGLFDLCFFLYLVRTEVRDRLR